ncbi:hypothetical protein GCM10010967_47280 [Dyadobacter beijingensis]|uniref:Uncharacterized protein n=1 Tax=Dyadobacter beijingensis TaxID=365489 RepID=A0ABQ2IFW4_9BACT|nr:hypothetical protein GCM10010967_47280 [Dyadobacter beijingensis]
MILPPKQGMSVGNHLQTSIAASTLSICLALLLNDQFKAYYYVYFITLLIPIIDNKNYAKIQYPQR